MQKKIKIPKLSLNHIEEAGEVTDYGEEDVELRHSKVLKSFLVLVFFFPSFPFFIFFRSACGIYKRPSLRIPGLLFDPLKTVCLMKLGHIVCGGGAWVFKT